MATNIIPLKPKSSAKDYPKRITRTQPSRRARAGAAGLHQVGDAVSRRHDTTASGGLPSPVRTPGLAGATAWRKDVLGVWRGATHREERHAAIELSGHRRARPFQTMEALPVYEEMIVTGAWWDFVDAVGTHRLRELLVRHPAPMHRAMRAWACDDDMWKRRAAILCQIGLKEETDLELLYACIEPSLESKEFFLRKAIGWALRQYAWTDPRAVVRYVRRNREGLSPLSKREALKNVLRQGLIAEIP